MSAADSKRYFFENQGKFGGSPDGPGGIKVIPSNGRRIFDGDTGVYPANMWNKRTMTIKMAMPATVPKSSSAMR